MTQRLFLWYMGYVMSEKGLKIFHDYFSVDFVLELLTNSVYLQCTIVILETCFITNNIDAIIII